jgi:uncharacterized membrane protein SpoIIM required for sporulation
MAVTVDAFVRSRQERWTELEALLKRANGRPERLGADGVLRLGTLYRGAVADLARARRSFRGDPLLRPLEDLVGGARATIYAVKPRRASAVDYFARGYWRSVYERGAAIGIAWALVIVAAVLATVWGLHDPSAAAGVIPEKLSASGPPHHALGLGATQSAGLSISIFINNIRVTFLAFAAGIVLGVGTALLLLYNGLTTGAVIGIEAHRGYTHDLIVLLAPHGMLELSCIAVCGAAGMKMGWALVEPGTATRVEALRVEALRAVAVVLATAPWLIVAGCIEGFVTPQHLPIVPALLIGAALAGTYWTLVLVRGRPDAHSLSSALART